MAGSPGSARAARPTTVASAAVLTVALTVAGSVLGLGRDLTIARVFGADHVTDAFVVAWTIPETAFPLLVEGAMSFVMIPLLSQGLAQSGGVAAVLAVTVAPVTAALLIGSTAVALGAPVIVRLLAPGLEDPSLAVTCTRLAAVTVLAFGLTGYLSAALRAHHVFGAPATISLVYNTGILVAIWALHDRWGIMSAALGLALGSIGMVVALLPSFLRHVDLPRRLARPASLIPLAVVAPVVVFTLARQAQVFVERFWGSGLGAGAISHLNYAQKIAQLPMLVALLLCTVSFPTLARAVAEGRLAAARQRLEDDLRAVVALVSVAAAYLVVFAPEVVAVLFEHGRFDAADTSATAWVLRIYAAGLIGHVLVGVLVRPYVVTRTPAWHPVTAMAAGLVVTGVVASVSAPRIGVPGIAVANGVGILVAAVLLLRGLRRGGLAVSPALTRRALPRLAVVGAGSGLAGWLVRTATAGWPPLVVALVGGAVVVGAFVALAWATGSREVTGPLLDARRRLRHGR